MKEFRIFNIPSGIFGMCTIEKTLLDDSAIVVGTYFDFKPSPGKLSDLTSVFEYAVLDEDRIIGVIKYSALCSSRVVTEKEFKETFGRKLGLVMKLKFLGKNLKRILRRYFV